ncbi:DNA mismatch repair protein MutS [Candidatus Dojkabacteria bacterium]|nr:DNA mismatch repair protein MutS [Candidatus Dojkabacteria bacterium]
MATPMMKQYNKLKKENKDAILLFRLGDFYEAFDDDANTISKILGITLTGRGKGENRRPMAGIPFHSLDNYLPKLIKAGKKVAIAEQLSEPKPGEIVERDIIKIHTSGTYTNEKNLQEEKNHFISCIHINKKKKIYLLALLDLSTGEFFSESFNDYNGLLNNLFIYNPAEILVSKSFEKTDLKLDNFKVEYIWDDDFDLKRSYEILLKHFNTTSLKGFGISKTNNEIIPLGVLLRYALENHKTKLQHVTKVQIKDKTNLMNLDFETVRNLELVQNIRDEGDPLSLFEVLNRCMTSMGKRKLYKWIIAPLIKYSEIDYRLNIVDFFYRKIDLTNELKDTFNEILDIERIISKIGTGSINPRDLLGLEISLKSCKSIFQVLNNLKQNEILKKMISNINPDNYNHVINLINKSIQEDCPVKFDKGGIIKDGYNNEIDELRDIVSHVEDYLLQLQKEEQEKTGIDSLKIKFNKVFGYYIEITKSNIDKVPDRYTRKQTLVNSERYFTPELKKYEEKIISAEEQLIELEKEVFDTIIEEISEFINQIIETANKIAELDVYTNFALLSKERNYVKPEIIKDTNDISIKNSRHPVVELIKKHEYIPNDIILNENGSLIILTGPNMSGKSTYIRQVALNILMAQIGCFVPCDEAKICIVDRIFTRVGASDNLAAGESTFMIEMNETANILNNATKNSLIIIDEVGRGTSTYDGVAIAWSVVEYIHEDIGAKTLFATHYHELINLEKKFIKVKNLHVDVDESGDSIIFTHDIKAGGVDQSYGVHVAEMAGVPTKVIRRAKAILEGFEKSNKSTIKKNKKSTIQPKSPQIELL